MDVKHRLQRLLKPRFAIMYPFALYLIIFANSDDASIVQSIGFIVAGIMLRAWANGYAIKNDKLTLSGPYAFVRHPLYLGSTLIVVGFIIMLKIYVLGLVFLPIFLWVYLKTMRKEEDLLIDKFGKDYINYKKLVHGLLPRLTPYLDGIRWPFSWLRLLHSKEYKISLWVIIIVIAFHIKEELTIEGESLNFRILMFITLAVGLALMDIAAEYLRKAYPLKSR